MFDSAFDSLSSLTWRPERFALLAAGSFVLVSFAALLAVRARRSRMWKGILAQPAEVFSDQKLKWKRSLPRSIKLNSKEPLFELLYENYKAQPKIFSPESLGEAMDGVRQQLSSEKRASGKPPAQPITEEEQVNQLVSIQAYPSDPSYMPVEALATSFLVNFLNVLKGKKKLATGMEHAVLDSLAPGGGFAGAKLGGFLGVAAYPMLAGAATFAVPVIMLLGAYLGSLAGKKIGNRVKARKIYTAIRKLTQVSKVFRKSFLTQFPELMRQLDREFESRMAYTEKLYRKEQNRMTRFFFPGLMTTFLKLSLERLKADWEGNRKEWKVVKKKVRVMPPMEFAHVLHALSEQAFIPFPELHAHYQAYESAVSDLQAAQEKVA